MSKDELDYNDLNNKINRANGSTYAGKVNIALQSIVIPSARFSNTGNGAIYFKVAANDNKAVAGIVAFDKQ